MIGAAGHRERCGAAVGPDSQHDLRRPAAIQHERAPLPVQALAPYRVGVPVGYRLSAARTVTTEYRTVVVTSAQAKALRAGTHTIVWTRHGKGDRITNPRVVTSTPASSATDASSLDPFTATFRGQILALLRSGHARVAGHAALREDSNR